MSTSTVGILDIVYVPRDPQWQFPLHEHDDAAELSLVTGGTGHFYSEGREWTVTEGTLIIKNAGMSHSEKSDREDPMEQICISLSLPDRDHRLLPEGLAPVLDVTERMDLFSSLFRFLRDRRDDRSFGEACRHAAELLVELTDIAIARCDPVKETGRIRREDLPKQIKRYLDEHYRENLKIPDLAARFYVSEGYLSRRFKEHTGYTVNDYILSKRMGQAQKMLLFEDRSIKEIALSVGYEDLQYFYHVFRKYSRCTPAQFREQYRESGALD